MSTWAKLCGEDCLPRVRPSSDGPATWYAVSTERKLRAHSIPSRSEQKISGHFEAVSWAHSHFLERTAGPSSSLCSTLAPRRARIGTSRNFACRLARTKGVRPVSARRNLPTATRPDVCSQRRLKWKCAMFVHLRAHKHRNGRRASTAPRTAAQLKAHTRIDIPQLPSKARRDPSRFNMCDVAGPLGWHLGTETAVAPRPLVGSLRNSRRTLT
ncbi:hypothetical protein C2E23DRAFT_500641 [Lenzites betulinus]|nr:hypothetical protein C2E23DRAFT_500641 [Lenzites betulinus]